MIDTLWMDAKDKARLLGKENDWVFVMTLYREMGGTIMSITVTQQGVQSELVGQRGDRIITADIDGGMVLYDVEEFLKLRKQFCKRDLTKATETFRVVVDKDDETVHIPLYEGVVWN